MLQLIVFTPIYLGPSSFSSLCQIQASRHISMKAFMSSALFWIQTRFVTCHSLFRIVKTKIEQRWEAMWQWCYATGRWWEHTQLSDEQQHRIWQHQRLICRGSEMINDFRHSPTHETKHYMDALNRTEQNMKHNWNTKFFSSIYDREILFVFRRFLFKRIFYHVSTCHHCFF